MNCVIKFLEENPLVYLATNGLDNNSKIRLILYYFEEDEKPYFCTSNKKNQCIKKCKKNSNIEITTVTHDYAWLRISTQVEFTDDIELKQKVIDANDLVKVLYQSGDNPEFEVFTLKNAKAVLADFSGNPPKNMILIPLIFLDNTLLLSFGLSSWNSLKCILPKNKSRIICIVYFLLKIFVALSIGHSIVMLFESILST
mgnify:FL=1